MVNIRICQPENSDVHRGELENDAPIVFFIGHCLSFPCFNIYKLLKSDVLSAPKTRLFQQLLFEQVSETLMRCAKELHFFKSLFS